MSALGQKQTLAPDANCRSSINNLLGAERRHSRLPAVDHYRCLYRKPKPGRSGDEVRQGSRVT